MTAVTGRQPVTLTRVQAVACMREGQAAGRAAKPATECPYSPCGDASERVRVQAWLRGYLAAVGRPC